MGLAWKVNSSRPTTHSYSIHLAVAVTPSPNTCSRNVNLRIHANGGCQGWRSDANDFEWAILPFYDAYMIDFMTSTQTDQWKHPHKVTLIHMSIKLSAKTSNHCFHLHVITGKSRPSHQSIEQKGVYRIHYHGFGCWLWPMCSLFS